jgi:hypothetical protein
MRRRIAGSIRATVTEGIPGHDPVPAGKVGDLGLPDSRVDDLPRRYEHDRRVARAVDLVEDADVVSLDEPGFVRISRAGRFGWDAVTGDQRRSAGGPR